MLSPGARQPAVPGKNASMGSPSAVESHASLVHVFGKPCQFGVIKPCLESIIYTPHGRGPGANWTGRRLDPQPSASCQNWRIRHATALWWRPDMGDRGTAVVTGASSGIGPASVTALAADGWTVVSTVRVPGRADALTEIAGSRDAIGGPTARRHRFGLGDRVHRRRADRPRRHRPARQHRTRTTPSAGHDLVSLRPRVTGRSARAGETDSAVRVCSGIPPAAIANGRRGVVTSLSGREWRFTDTIRGAVESLPLDRAFGRRHA